MESSTTTDRKPITSIKEGKAEIQLTSEKVFYNPVQEFNRDLSIAVLTIFGEEYRAEKSSKGKNKKPCGDSAEVNKYPNFLCSEYGL